MSEKGNSNGDGRVDLPGSASPFHRDGPIVPQSFNYSQGSVHHESCMSQDFIEEGLDK